LEYGEYATVIKTGSKRNLKDLNSIYLSSSDEEEESYYQMPTSKAFCTPLKAKPPIMLQSITSMKQAIREAAGGS
jgi:hypothetical protein